MDVNIYYGVSNLTDEIRCDIKEKLKAQGYNVLVEHARGIKSGIDNLVECYAREEPLILVLAQYLEKANPFSIGDLMRYQKLQPSAKIILVVSKEEKGKELLKAMSDNGLYHALFDSEATPRAIAGLVAQGRSVVEAKTYYGVDTAVLQKKTLTIDSALTYMKQPVVQKGEYVDRISWVQSSLPTDAMFCEVIKRLPTEIKDVLAESERYAGYLRDYIARIAEGEKERDSSPKPTQAISAGYVKNAVSRAVRSSVIGVTGAQEHIGCTHQALLIAHGLSAKGYRVAVVEDVGQENRAFESIGEAEGYERGKPFTIKGVDYYPEFSLNRLSFLNTKGYKFIVVDFGVFREDIVEEFGRCMLPVVISGSKPWETDNLDGVFGLVEESQLVRIHYLFLFTPGYMVRKIKRDMGELKNVYFGDYEPNPFSTDCYSALKMILKDYMVTCGDAENVRRKGLVERVKEYFI